MPTLKLSLGIGFNNARQHGEVEIDEDEWNDCETEEEREELINQYAQDWARDYIDIDSEVVEQRES